MGVTTSPSTSVTNGLNQANSNSLIEGLVSSNQALVAETQAEDNHNQQVLAQMTQQQNAQLGSMCNMFQNFANSLTSMAYYSMRSYTANPPSLPQQSSNVMMI